nr:immunoglobulin heavy chain junction region [Macaca mulatta]MOX93157.1 immunoglobulin heavy chain junction region [Macaca mulatta]MOX95444.1 immunoglobulin heavy chain junction region [Macaca mulatta]
CVKDDYGNGFDYW